MQELFQHNISFCVTKLCGIAPDWMWADWMWDVGCGIWIYPYTPFVCFETQQVFIDSYFDNDEDAEGILLHFVT